MAGGTKTGGAIASVATGSLDRQDGRPNETGWDAFPTTVFAQFSLLNGEWGQPVSPNLRISGDLEREAHFEFDVAVPG